MSCAREAGARLDDVSLVFETGSVTGLCGPEGCGKNLLLRLLGLWEVPDRGGIYLHEERVDALGEEARLALRNQHFGFVFAEPFLLNNLSVIENVAMPLLKIGGATLEHARARTVESLEFFKLAALSESPVGALAFADQRQVSLARALANRPEILLVENADAPPEAFAKSLVRANETFGVTVIFTAAGCGRTRTAHRSIELSGGRILRDFPQPAAFI